MPSPSGLVVKTSTCLHETLRSLRVAQDGGQRLAQLVRQRSRELAQSGYARHMRELGAHVLQLCLGASLPGALQYEPGGIREDRLPPESEVRYRQQSVWEAYRWHVAAAVALMLLQAALIRRISTRLRAL